MASFTSSVNLSWMVDDVLAMSESVSSKPLETESFIGEVNEAFEIKVPVSLDIFLVFVNSPTLQLEWIVFLKNQPPLERITLRKYYHNKFVLCNHII
jgi:hypothetical protein